MRCVLQPDVQITLDTLYLVFSAFGEVQKIATFEKNAGLQALVQYADISVADQVCTGHHCQCHPLLSSFQAYLRSLDDLASQSCMPCS